MADIFLSYTEKDRETVRRLAETLQSVGWSVWWDRRIPAGQTWRSVLDHELQQMRCMIVLWSAHSVLSEWVCEEAAEGRRLGRLVPVSIDRVRPPAGFREIQAADLVDWDGKRDHVGLQRLIEDIQSMIGHPASAQRDERPAAGRSDAEPSVPPAMQGEDVDGRGTPGLVPAAPASAGPATPWLRRWPWGLAALLVLIAAGLWAGAPWRDDAAPGAAAESAPSVTTTVAMPPPTTVQPAPAASPAGPGPTAVQPTPAAPPGAQTTAAASSAAGQAGPAKNLRRPPARTAQAPRTGSARCAALLERLALGETLSSASQTIFDQECRQ